MKRLFVAFFLLLCAAPLMAAEDDYPLEIARVNAPRGVRVVAINKGPATVTVLFRLSGESIAPGADRPRAEVVLPDSSREIVTVSARRWERVQFDFHHVVVPGDAFTPPDKGYFYRLPFRKGTRTEVVQAPGGTLTTHIGPQTLNAVDFAVPEGTPVTAAREGTVIAVKDDFTDGRFDPALEDKANFVAVMHADRGVAYYLHLAPHGIVVRPGQRVKTGETLARSGNTGYTAGPHLHFDVRRAVVKSDGELIQESVPVDFYRPSGEKISLHEGAKIVVE
ncbi:MAG: M23 family metallopeptidase [Azoarcus sp.]|jgi:murein DD-endopeptidase MepM/ murein hydrolase activator NlpD|nr:M23 family metallopeptidase [Azoarcus sp.]